MKRKADTINGQTSLKRPGLHFPSDDIVSKIAEKLSNLLNASLRELSVNAVLQSDAVLQPDLCRKSSRIKSFVKLEPAGDQDVDPLTQSLLNFINLAKVRFSELFHREREVSARGRQRNRRFQRSQLSSGNNPESVDPLRSQISEKLQSLLSKALEESVVPQNASLKVQTHNGPIAQSFNDTWKDISTLFENFVKSARKKLIRLHSKDPLEVPNSSVSIQKRLQEPKSLFKNLPSSSCEPVIKNLTIAEPELLKQKLRLSFKRLHSSEAPGVDIHTAPPTNMESLIPFDSFSNFDSTSFGLGDCGSLDYGTGPGILLMDEAEHAPDVLNLEVILHENDESHESLSEPEVLCLGEKVPTYEVVTIEEDDECIMPQTPMPGLPNQGNLSHPVKKSDPGQQDRAIPNKSFDCSHCGKKYKVESLLKFHVRMHGQSLPHVLLSKLSSEEICSINGESLPLSAESRSRVKKKRHKSKKGVMKKTGIQKKKNTHCHKRVATV